MTTFEEFALDHTKHAHCRGCNGCIIDPNPFIQQFRDSVWCVGCRDRIKKNTRPGVPLPWTWTMEWNTRTFDGGSEHAPDSAS